MFDSGGFYFDHGGSLPEELLAFINNLIVFFTHMTLTIRVTLWSRVECRDMLLNFFKIILCQFIPLTVIIVGIIVILCRIRQL